MSKVENKWVEWGESLSFVNQARVIKKELKRKGIKISVFHLMRRFGILYWRAKEILEIIK